MNKEEILSSAQKKPVKNDEFEAKVLQHACMLTVFATIIIGLPLLIIGFLVSQKINYSLVILLFAIFATEYLYEGIKLKKVLQIIFGVLSAIVSVLTIIFVLVCVV